MNSKSFLRNYLFIIYAGSTKSFAEGWFKEMTASCLRHGKWVPTLYNILVNSGMDLGFIGTGDGSS
jgi:hypothetical protein